MEKAVQRIGGLMRDLFREEMACLERAALDIVPPGSPERERSALLGIPAAQGSEATPERQERTDNAPPALAVRVIMHTIKGRGSPILLADGMDMNGVAHRLDIRCAHLRTKDGRRRAPAGKCLIDNGFRHRCEEALGKGFRLGE